MTSDATTAARTQMSRRIMEFGPEPFLRWHSLAEAADHLWHDWTRVQTGQTPTGEYVHAFHRDTMWCVFMINQAAWNFPWRTKDHISRWFAFTTLMKGDQIVFADTLTDIVERAVELANDDSCGGWAIAASALLGVDHPDADAARTLAALGGLGGVSALEARRTEKMSRLRALIKDSLSGPRAPSRAGSGV